MGDTMKILHLISGGDVGGAKTHVLSLLQGLSKSETVRLVCFMDGPFAEEARLLGIDTKVISSKNPFSVVKELSKMVRTESFEIVHCHGSRANLMGVMLKHRVRATFVTTVHSDYRLDYLGRPFSRLTYGTINTYCVRRIPNHICVSDSMVDTLISRGFSPHNLFSIYNGVNFRDITTNLDRKSYFESIQLSVDPEDVVFGIAARLSAVKDIPTLLRAFSAAQKRFPHIKLLIAGDGEQRGDLEKLAAEICLPGSYRFLGWIEDTDSFYNAIDVNMLTSLSEGFPYALPEGARMHCATISSRVGGVPYMIEHGVNGLLFEPQNVEQLTKHMLLFAENELLRNKMADALFDRGAKDFSEEATVNRQLEIYRILVRRKNRPVMKRDGVLICGAYGKGNAGDDSILEAIVRQLRNIDPDIPVCVLSRNPKQTKTRYRIDSVHTFGFISFLRRMGKTSLYINGGGSLIQDATSTRSLQYYLWNIALAKIRGNKVLMYGCGIGPVSEKNRSHAGRVINRYVDLITLRESQSAVELQILGVDKPEVWLTADPALLLEPASVDSVNGYMISNGMDPQAQYALIALRPWSGFEEKVPIISEAIQRLYENTGITPVFMAFEPSRDIGACKMVQKKLSCESHLLSVPDDGHLIAGFMGRMQLLVSMRLHALIFASGIGVPLVGIVYDPKVSGFLEYLGQNRYVQLNELYSDNLNDMIAAALAETRDQYSASRLRELAAKNEEAARKLLQS